MAGFGPTGTPFVTAPDPNQQRLQYYSSQQPQPQVAPNVSKDVGGRRAGKVKFFDTQKGYGFINDYRAEEIGNEEVFVHYTAITAKAGFKSLAEGEEAEYEIVRGPKGFQAANVTGPGGSQVVGDTRSRANKNAFLAMSPYAAMFPYIHQDPTSFYTNSPYTQPLMLMPQAAEYRNPTPHHQSPYRGVPPPPAFAANPSPYGSPAPIRPYDIGKDFAGVNLAGLSVDEGIRGSKALGGSAVPFGGMFGPVAGFGGQGPSQGSSGVSAFPSSSSAAPASSVGPGVPIGGNPYKGNAASVTGRSGSADQGGTGASPRDTLSLQTEPSATTSRPPPQHSRSASLLFPPKQSNPSAGM